MSKYCIVFFCLLLTIGCSNARLNKKNKNELIVCTNSGYAPYEFIQQNGEIDGFDIELAREICKQLNKKIILKDISFDSLILGLKQNKCDIIIAALSITPSRRKEIHMIPYQKNQIKSFYLLFWKDTPITLDALKNKHIAVLTGSWMEDYLSKQKNINIKTLNSNDELIMELKFKKCSAMIAEPYIAKDILQKNTNFSGIEIHLPKKDWVLGNGIGVKKSNTDLKKNIEIQLNALTKNGSVAKIEKKWFK